jgi:hypothetical protein
MQQFFPWSLEPLPEGVNTGIALYNGLLRSAMNGVYFIEIQIVICLHPVPGHLIFLLDKPWGR